MRKAVKLIQFIISELDSQQRYGCYWKHQDVHLQDCAAAGTWILPGYDGYPDYEQTRGAAEASTFW